MNSKITLENNFEFQDIVLSALRYALYRHTYIFQETIDWIESNLEIVNERMKQVMLNNIEKRFEDGGLNDDEFETLKWFREKLINFHQVEVRVDKINEQIEKL